MRLGSSLAHLAFVLSAFAALPAQADRIRNPTAVFSGLDKITGRIISFEVRVDETVQFGSLQITPRVCWSRPPTEAPQTTSFVEVDEITFSNEIKRLFTGWVFAGSPGLSGIEHAVYDAWLIDCKGGTEIVTEAKEKFDEVMPARDEKAKSDRPSDRPRSSAPVDLNQPPRSPSEAPPPRRQPTQRFYPTNPGGPDPAGR